MTHVLCLCPSRHVFATLNVNDSIAPEYVVEIISFAVTEILKKPGSRSTCDKCGAPAESWVYEVAPPSVEGEEYEYDERTTIMGGVSVDA